MESVTHYPILVFALTFPAMWLASLAGLLLRKRKARVDDKPDEDFDLIVAATLTLLALIIGFSFSMATSRYDQRKNLEAAEANAIGTEYERVDLLPAADAASVHALLVAYLDERISAYATIDAHRRALINQRTVQLQAALWAGVRGPATAQPTAVMALVVAGMNEVLESERYMQAAVRNRIPQAAWALMVAIALCSNLLLGFGSRSSKLGGGLALVLPFLVAISFLLIADIDEPRHGLIQVGPDNLQSLARSLGR